jgi:hypothetical protein
LLLTDLDKVTADVLGKMMMARDEETGQTMTDEELRDQVMTLMLAGHEVRAIVHVKMVTFRMIHVYADLKIFIRTSEAVSGRQTVRFNFGVCCSYYYMS